MVVHDPLLGGIWVIPVFIIAWLPPTMGDYSHLYVRGAHGAVQPVEVVEKPDVIRDRLEARINLSALGQEVRNSRHRSASAAVATACLLDPSGRVNRYSDIRRPMERRQFANQTLVIDELPDRRHDGSASVVCFTNDAKAAAEILAALLLGELVVIARG